MGESMATVLALAFTPGSGPSLPAMAIHQPYPSCRWLAQVRDCSKAHRALVRAISRGSLSEMAAFAASGKQSGPGEWVLQHSHLPLPKSGTEARAEDRQGTHSKNSKKQCGDAVTVILWPLGFG